MWLTVPTCIHKRNGCFISHMQSFPACSLVRRTTSRIFATCIYPSFRAPSPHVRSMFRLSNRSLLSLLLLGLLGSACGDQHVVRTTNYPFGSSTLREDKGNFGAYINVVEPCASRFSSANRSGLWCGGSHEVQLSESCRSQACQSQRGTLLQFFYPGAKVLNMIQNGQSADGHREVNSGLVLRKYSYREELEFGSTIIAPKKLNNTLSFEEPSMATIIVAFGGCFIFSCAFLCPCLQPKKKQENSSLSFKEIPSTSMSTSLGESSTVGSFSVSSSHSPSSRQLVHKSNRGRVFSLVEISKATSNFSPTYKIGQGSHGIVYKGKLKDGTVVAIKRAKKVIHESRISTEFENEVHILLCVDHLNLVKLIGYLEENNEWFLVTEYVPNGNLREHLDCAHGIAIDLSTRLDICIDVAHALTYLHLYADKPIIHRDVKSTNILLTDNFRAKVADFGYSRVGPLELGATHVSTQVKGTAGYLDPEYLRTFQLTEKSDVYSFGVLLAEIITGRRPIEQQREMKERITLRWAFKKYLDGKVSDILDPRLKGTPATYMVVERISELAFQCSAPSKQDRPNMKRVAEVLWDIRKDYQNILQKLKSEATGSPDLAGKEVEIL